MNKLLDEELVYKLRDVINETNIFTQDKEEKEKFELICAVMDRFDQSIEYLNHNQVVPKTDEQVILYFHHCCIIKDGIKEVCKILNITTATTNFLEKYCLFDPINLPPNNYMGDDKFFEYLRSLFFAHPFITDRSIPNPAKGEVQYSPYILNNIQSIYNNSKDSIGIMVYSNKRDMFHVIISIHDINEYILKKYLIIEDIIVSFQKIIEDKNKEWLKRKVNRKLSGKLILEDIIDILKERYIDCGDIETLLKYLICDITIQNNLNIVEKFRDEINRIIPSICNDVDKMDYEELYRDVSSILHPKLKEKHPMMHYQLEKIYCYLNDDYGDTDFGLKMAEQFANQFARNWVTIDTYSMTFDEIKLLTTVACYYEGKKDGDTNE